jgi:hypothetical protein
LAIRSKLRRNSLLLWTQRLRESFFSIVGFMIKKDIVAQVQKNVCRPLLVLSSVWRGAPSPTFDQTTQISENGTPCLSAAMGDFITCGAATPKLLSAASSSHRGRRPSVSVLSESTVGASIA